MLVLGTLEEQRSPMSTVTLTSGARIVPEVPRHCWQWRYAVRNACVTNHCLWRRGVASTTDCFPQILAPLFHFILASTICCLATETDAGHQADPAKQAKLAYPIWRKIPSKHPLVSLPNGAKQLEENWQFAYFASL